LPEVRGAPAAFRNVVKAAAQHWFTGSLTFVLPSGKRVHIEGRAPGPDAELQVQDFRFVGRMLAAGDIGLAEGYMAGEWDTPDLTALLKAAALNLERLQMLVRGHPLVAAVHGLQHALNANTRKGARRNIIAHYDLGNDFYRQWLDPSMTYSSALFERPEETLTEAQHDKYAALARRMQLEPGQSVLEIGCGWGTFGIRMAQTAGVRVTGVTISKEQLAEARQRVEAADEVAVRALTLSTVRSHDVSEKKKKRSTEPIRLGRRLSALSRGLRATSPRRCVSTRM
jgi:cyclopropane-fatty-acyl-phospholipid synthase